MKKLLTPGRIALGLLLLLVAFGIAAWWAPQTEADSWREPLRTALTRALGRDVTFRDVRYTLFPHPGLTASELVIPDDPAFGLEPFAYVTEFQVGLRWSALLTGRFEIATVRMTEPSVNLSRRDGIGWNAGRLLEHLRARGLETGSAPRLVLENGRINFRQGTMKSPFFLNAVELDLAPPSRATGSFDWSFEASPARTDRSEQGFGRFTGQGLWRPGPGREGQIEVEMELERSATSEVATLITGGDLGLQGRLSSRATLLGPLNDIQLRGAVELEGLGRGGMLSTRTGGWTLHYQGKLNLAAQRLEFSTVPSKEGGAASLLNLQFSVDSMLTSPRWQASVSFQDVRAANALQLAERLGARVPAGLEVDGTLSGSVEWPRNGEPSGAVQLDNAAVRLRGAGPVKIQAASLRLAGGVVELLPAEMESPSQSVLSLSGKWAAASEALSFVVGMKDLPLDEFTAAASVIPGASLPPALAGCEQGRVSGEVRFARDSESEPAPWAGELSLIGPVCRFDGTSETLNVTRALINFRGPDWSARRVTAQWGALAVDAAAEFRAAARRPLRMTLDFNSLDLEEMERLLEPALVRRRSFLDRTFRRRAVIPEWLAQRRVEAALRARRIVADGHEIQRLSAQIYWDGVHVQIPSLDFAAPEGSFSGRLAVALGADAPSYHLLGRVSDLRWQDASVEADVDLRSSGMGSQLRQQLRADGQFHAQGLVIDGEALRNAAGCYDYDARRPAGGELRLRCLEAVVDGDLLSGTGGSSGDGRVAMEISSPRRTLRLGGAVWPLSIDLSTGPVGQSR